MMLHVPFTSWGLIHCSLTRNGLGPIAGHCPHCDAKLYEADLAELAEWLEHRGGLMHWNWNTKARVLARNEWGKLTSPESKTRLKTKLKTEEKDERPEDKRADYDPDRVR